MNPPHLHQRAGRHSARHPPLMDGGHYGSWGQVPLTIKGPSQRLGKNGSGNRGERETETVAAERVNTSAAGRADRKRAVRRGRRGHCRWRRDRWRRHFPRRIWISSVTQCVRVAKRRSQKLQLLAGMGKFCCYFDSTSPQELFLLLFFHSCNPGGH